MAYLFQYIPSEDLDDLDHHPSVKADRIHECNNPECSAYTDADHRPLDARCKDPEYEVEYGIESVWCAFT